LRISRIACLRTAGHQDVQAGDRRLARGRVHRSMTARALDGSADVGSVSGPVARKVRSRNLAGFLQATCLRPCGEEPASAKVARRGCGVTSIHELPDWDGPFNEPEQALISHATSGELLDLEGDAAPGP
jgi:hypothetical protein